MVGVRVVGTVKDRERERDGEGVFLEDIVAAKIHELLKRSRLKADSVRAPEFDLKFKPPTQTKLIGYAHTE